MRKTALQLHDKYTEEIIGTVLLKEDVEESQVRDAWDKFQKYNNTNSVEYPNIYDFESENMDICEVLFVDFYQP